MLDSPLNCIYKRPYTHEMILEWNPLKAARNRTRHGLDFADAGIVCEGETLTFEDDRYDYGEPRFITFGWLRSRLVVIAHTPCGDANRIISMRKANEREQKSIEKRLAAARRHER